MPTMPNHPARPAVLLLAHGTPNALGEMADYLSLVTGGRPLPHSVIEELQHRYAKIGLRDTPGTVPPPLTHWTLAQRDRVEAFLAEHGTPMLVYAAMRNWHPLIADVIRQIRADGITQLTTLCLAPQNSRTSIGLYRRAVMTALAATAPTGSDDPLELTFIEAWPEEPKLIQAFAEQLQKTYLHASEAAQAALPILFTAHSVPCRTIISSDSKPGENTSAAVPCPAPDPYPVEAKRTAELVFQQTFGNADTQSPSRANRRPPEWFFAFQSQGVAGGPWIGPTVEDTLAAIARQGYSGVVLQPIGFVCDHVEVLYDIDIAFQETARGLGLRLFRPESLNDSPQLTEAIVNVLQNTWKTRSEQVTL